MSVLDWITKAGDLAANARNVEIQGALLEIKREVLNLQAQLLDRDRRIAELERRQAEPAHYKHASYYVTKADGSEDGPFCQRCYDAEGKFIRTHDQEMMLGTRRSCPECKSTVWPNGQRRPPTSYNSDS